MTSLTHFTRWRSGGHGESEWAPAGKLVGLSPAAYRMSPSQRPTLQATPVWRQNPRVRCSNSLSSLPSRTPDSSRNSLGHSFLEGANSSAPRRLGLYTLSLGPSIQRHEGLYEGLGSVIHKYVEYDEALGDPQDF